MEYKKRADTDYKPTALEELAKKEKTERQY